MIRSAYLTSRRALLGLFALAPAAARAGGGARSAVGDEGPAIAVPVVSIGAFRTASGAVIPRGARLVQTVEWAAGSLRGGALYVEDSAFDLAAHPRAGFAAADRRIFRYHAPEGLFRVSAFGAVGDGVADDQPAITACIEACQAAGGGVVGFEQGRYLCRQPVWHGHDDADGGRYLLSGITFRSLGLQYFDGTAMGNPGTTIVHAGPGVLFRIARPNDRHVGGWSWDGLGFQATDPAGTLFDIGVPDRPSYPGSVQNCGWFNCQFLGANAPGVAQTGDAIRGATLFHATVDARCTFRGWRRAVWLKGSDINEIRGRFLFNGRHCMIQKGDDTLPFTTGNDTLFAPGYCGEVQGKGGEPPHHLWDNAFTTRVEIVEAEQVGQAAPYPDALLYLDGLATRVFGTSFVGSADQRPFAPFRLGPNGRDIVFVSPTAAAGGAPPIFDAPASWDFGCSLTRFFILVTGSTRLFRQLAGDHPRLIYDENVVIPGPVRRYQGRREGSFSDGAGVRRSHLFHMDALCYVGTSLGFSAAGNDIVPDAAASTGWACRFSVHGTPSQGFITPELSAGLDFAVGDRLQVSLRYRYDRAGKGGQINLVPYHNGTPQAGCSVPNATSYGIFTFILPVVGWKTGDTLRFNVNAYSSDAGSFMLDSFDVNIVDEVPADAIDLGSAVKELAAIKQILLRHRLIG